MSAGNLTVADVDAIERTNERHEVGRGLVRALIARIRELEEWMRQVRDATNTPLAGADIDERRCAIIQTVVDTAIGSVAKEST